MILNKLALMATATGGEANRFLPVLPKCMKFSSSYWFFVNWGPLNNGLRHQLMYGMYYG